MRALNGFREIAARDPRAMFVIFVVFLAVALGNSSRPPARMAAAHLEPLPTFDVDAEMYIASPQLCDDLNAAWGNDWPRVIYDLQTIHGRGDGCGDKDLYLLLYPAYYNYGVWLEQRGNLKQAIDAYQHALTIQPDGPEASQALLKHNALPPRQLSTCAETQIMSRWAQVPAYRPQMLGDFVHLDNGAFAVNGQAFAVHGVNYYPSRFPWRRFLTESDTASITRELDLIQGAGFNTMRIFLWYDALFDCEGMGVVPNPAAFARLDTLLHLAAARGIRLIVTLNDLPDLLSRPLYRYNHPPDDQTLYIVQRYRDEPAILAWDLRNEGDIDWIRGSASMRDVLTWLRALAPQVRAADPHHLITAGWNEHSQYTDSAVDFLSFHHWRTGENLTARVAALRGQSSKPILVEELGYSSYGGTEDRQASQFQDALTAVQQSGVLGWVVWTAFDFSADAACTPPACPGKDNGELHFGLWRLDYTPKPALSIIRRFIDAP